MALMDEANGDDVKNKIDVVKKDNKKDDEPLPDYDAVVAADVEGISHCCLLSGQDHPAGALCDSPL